MKYKKYYKNMIFLLSALIISVICGGFYFSNTVREKTSTALKDTLLNRVRILSSLINYSDIKKLNGDIGDKSSEVYLTYKRLFLSACNSQDDIRYIYMMGRRGGQIFFFADSEPDSKADPEKPLAVPGEIYQDPPRGLEEVFREARKDYTVGPYTDRWGTFFSAMLPVFDLNSKEVVCVVGMDIDARDWNFIVFESGLRVWAMAAAIILVLLSLIYNMRIQLKRVLKMEAKLFYQQAALKLAQQDNSDYKTTLERIVKCAAETLEVRQAGVWRFSEDFSSLICQAVYNSKEAVIKPGYSLAALNYPHYFKELNLSRTIAAADARTDERTRELFNDYLRVQNISSMLDTMIWLHGRPAGVLCIEHTRGVKHWQEEEIDFAKTLSDLLSLVFEADERVKAEKEEKESKLYLEKIINSVADPIFVKDINHRFILVNESFCRILDKKYYEIVGKSDDDFFPPDQVYVFKKRDDHVFETGENDINEEQITDASGSVRTIITKKTLYQDNEGGRYIVGVIRDITEQKKMDEERSKIGKLESLGMLAGGIAHDFNNILMGILGNISLAKNRCASDTGVRDVLVRAEAVVHKARALTEQLITFSKGGLPIKKKCMLNEIVKNTVHFTLSGSKIKPVFDIAPDLNMVEIDEGQFNQVLANLIINARQASEDSGEINVSVCNFETVTSEVFPHKAGGYLKVSITDNGPGIAPEDITKIFDPYFTTKPSGSGLGLFTSYSIINKHGGFIRAVTGLSKGASIEIYLPAAPPENGDAPHNLKVFSARQIDNSVPAVLYKILIMDDELDSLAPVCDILSEHGCYVTLAENGDDALKIYEQKMKTADKFDVAVVDIIVKKGMGGEEFIKKLFTLDPAAKTIVSSGCISDKLMIDYKLYGFCSAIAKPYKAEDLLALITDIASAGAAQS
jgi:PAS domain S-box-containing protein